MQGRLGMSNGPVLDHWQATTDVAGAVAIYPDGCRDVIWTHVPGQRPGWIYTDQIDRSVRMAQSAARQSYLGWRMKSGVALSDPGLLARLPDDPARGLERLMEALTLPEDLADLLGALADPDLGRVDLVVAETRFARRTAERLIRKATGHGPAFWIRLARVRRAAAALREGVAPADAAADQGYADQAHLTREFRSWFGLTPGAVRAGRADLGALLLKGYAV